MSDRPSDHDDRPDEPAAEHDDSVVDGPGGPDVAAETEPEPTAAPEAAPEAESELEGAERIDPADPADPVDPVEPADPIDVAAVVAALPPASPDASVPAFQPWTPDRPVTDEEDVPATAATINVTAAGPSDDFVPIAPDRTKRKKLHRTWPQRAVLALNILIVVACFAGSAAVAFSTEKLNDRRIVAFTNPAETATVAPDTTVPLAPGETNAPTTAGPSATFPPADAEVKNYLITGADNNSCIDPDSPFAGGFGDRNGERSDTIMIMRIDTRTNQAAILSFPRDLWVTIAGTNSKRKINSAYQRDDPQLLIDTIYANFGVGVDHFVQVDFCAFKSIVDAIGGVTVPFDYAVRDTESGLDVPQAGCYTFEGDHALAYVRSRYLEYFDPGSNEWVDDPYSDLSRISRQQDFIRRAMSAALDTGITDPVAANRLINTFIDYVLTDRGLTPRKMLELAGVLREFDPGTVRTYQIQSSASTVGDQSVQIPEIDNEEMRAILAIFTGEAALSDAPDPSVTGGSTTAPPGAADAFAAVTAPTTTLPVVEPSQTLPGSQTPGVLPSTTLTCP